MILKKLADASRKRVEREKKEQPLERIREEALAREKGAFLLEKVLKEEGIHFICEVKKASPSKGIIAEEFPYREIAREYEQAGASAVSILTEPDYFLGRDEYVTQIRKEISIPILRKDFTIDEYQIYQAKCIGADAVLLICALLSKEELKEYLSICDTLGLSALVEAHDKEELQKGIEAGARIIGVNNRDLKTFQVDITNSIRLRADVPEEILFVAESGIKTAEDVNVLKEGHVNGVLIGETLMRSPNKAKTLALLKGECG